MKKPILVLMTLALMSSMLQARPIDERNAQRLAQSFVTANFEFSRQSTDLTLVKTAYSERGEACYYVFNVGTTGFVILAADDCVRPVIGYSDRGPFNPDDMAPALADYLEKTRLGIMAETQRGAGNAEVKADWAMLEKCGRLVSRHGGREDEFLVKTTWNQNYPYNYFCPEGAGGPGGRCYAGCVATAAAQLMKYWDHPIQGQGSYTYTPEDNPQYGPLTANFGETIYDWENMPNSISSSSPIEQIEAVALLIYHAGVSVDMNYRPNSSGAVTGKLCQTMPAYFFYTDRMANLYRENFTHESYMQLIINAIDMDWPMVHRGGGHAYVLDGYNDSDMVHFNWGWSGSSDGWFNIDNHGYTDGESVIYNYVPAEIYAATPNAPTDIVATAIDGDMLGASISWTNPVVTLTDDVLESIDQIVVERNGKVVYVEDNVAPGAEMSFTDEDIPFFDSYQYAVYAVVNGQRGASAFAEKVLIGPSCEWKIVMQTTFFQGWNGAYVSLYNAAGTEVCRQTMTSSIPVSYDIAVPVGNVSFGWTGPENTVNNVSFVIKDAEGNNVYTYSGSTNGMEEGIFLRINNNCGNEEPSDTPFGLMATMENGNAVLTWDDGNLVPEYGHNIYRDGQLYGFSTETYFVDEDITEGHCYTVTALGFGGETDESNETCASAGECMAAHDFFYEYTGNTYKIKLLWEKPEVHEGLSGYFLYRKQGEDGTYERIKLIGSNATSFTDNTANEEGDYYYRLYAYYSASECTSSPASVKYNPNLFYLHVYYSPTDVEEQKAESLSLYPNPADQTLRIEAEGMTRVTVCNMLGQVVSQQDCDGNMLIVNTSTLSEGLYIVTVQTANATLTRRLSVTH